MKQTHINQVSSAEVDGRRSHAQGCKKGFRRWYAAGPAFARGFGSAGRPAGQPYRRGITPCTLALFLALLCFSTPAISASYEATLTAMEAGGGVDISWTSQSLTPVAPFAHYEFQVQHSSDLMAWEDVSPVIPGGFLGSFTVPHVHHLNTTNAQRFVRLTYRLNMPGSNLSGLDLSGADLRGANLAGANLTGTRLDGTRLGGADLTGATLTGATFANANLQDLNLDGLNLSGFDFSSIQGTPLLTRITADEAGSVAQLVPALAYNANPANFDFSGSNPNLPGAISVNSAMLMLKTNVTVGQLNALLAAQGAAIVGSSPQDAFLPNAVLMVRFPTTSAQALFDLTVSLNNDPIVEAAAPDVLMGPTVVSSDATTQPDWKWDNAGTWAGGNWGLEFARVPQMWNLKSALEKKGAGRVPTCVIDVYFNPAHVDLSFQYMLGSPPLATNDHGNHVAGTIGASFDNNLGIDGVNPMPFLIGYTFRAMDGEYPFPLFPGALFESGRQANAYSMIQDVRDALRRSPETRILNMSLGYNWSHFTNASRPTPTSAFTLAQLANIEIIAAKYGALMAGVARSASSVLIVCGAGNDWKLVSARVASPMCTAALMLGTPNILVVESHGITGISSGFSNVGGHVAAPGENILSLGATSSWYTNLSGTSMSTPFVSGLAGFLMTADPSLTPAEVIDLVRRNGPNVDAYTSLMEIDTRLGHDREIVKMLIDVDDGTDDGCERLPVPEAALGNDRVFVRVDGPDVIGTDALGDGKIDMADFRRWRDWLVYSEGNAALNGSGFHPKLDGNRNRDPHPFDDQFHFPRGDFNGDGKLDQTSRRSVAGWFQDFDFTDIGVFVSSDLWEDPCYTDATVLFGLIDSADLHVSAENFYYKHTDIDAAGNVSVFNADTGEALPDGGTCAFSPD
ncbi:MAG TPA: S8 family serine peptidase, partial [Verrucomicrobiae bacterium]|nr:S8 family serine peptidase [Verrucomicrobiae bacterium]